MTDVAPASEPTPATVTQMLEAAAAATPHAPFLRTAHGEVTYADARRRSAGMATALLDMGVGQGTTVALMMVNSIDQVLLWFAIARIGAVHAPLNSALTGSLLSHALTVSGAEVIVIDDELLAGAAPAIRAQPGLRHVVLRGAGAEAAEAAEAAELGVVGFETLLRPLPEAAAVDVDEHSVATLLFTSGTTGASKACALSHRYLARQGQLHARQFGLRSGDVLYTPFPLFHIDAATLTTVAALSVGATAALGRRFSASGFWDEVRAFGATVFNFMGATLTILWKQPPTGADRTHSVRLAWGVPMPAWQEGWESRFGFPLYQVYGLTDGGVPVYDSPADGTPTGSCGRVLEEYEVRIVDSAGTGLPSGRVGEVEIRGREPGLVMNGYYAMPGATAEVFRGGWLRTGDLGRFDDDGYFFYEGRSSDSIRRRGENISAFEVEEIAVGHPDVVEVAAVGVPSELTEEDVKIFVVIRAGSDLTPAELHSYFRRIAPGFMVPRYIEFIEALPRTPTEKVEKFKLRSSGNGSRTWDADRTPGRA